MMREGIKRTFKSERNENEKNGIEGARQDDGILLNNKLETKELSLFSPLCFHFKKSRIFVGVSGGDEKVLLSTSHLPLSFSLLSLGLF